jgi:ASC-1-like (ASCH) protein
MAEIIKKCDKKYFDLIEQGKKDFEVRLADFEINEGDEFVLNEVVDGIPTGKSLRRKVKYVAKTKGMTYWPKEEIDKYGYQIIGLE